MDAPLDGPLTVRFVPWPSLVALWVSGLTALVLAWVGGRRLSRRGRWGLAAAIGVAGGLFAFALGHPEVDDGAVAKMEADWAPGDVAVLGAPYSLRERSAYQRLWVTSRMVGPELLTAKRLWVVGRAPLPSPPAAFVAPISTWRFGETDVALYGLPRGKDVTWRAHEAVSSAEVVLVRRDGRRLSCLAPAKRPGWRCHGGGEAALVNALMRVEGENRRCLRANLGHGEAMEVTFPHVPAGRVVGWVASADHDRPVTAAATVKIGDAVLRPRPNEVPPVVSVSVDGAPLRLVLEAGAVRGRRHVCAELGAEASPP